MVSSGDCNVQEKDTICQRRRVIRKKNHCSVLLFPISVMFPPTQEGTVWDVSCYYGDNQPRSLVWRSPWPQSSGSLEWHYEVGIWSLTQVTSFEPMAAPIHGMEEGCSESMVLLLSWQPCLSSPCTFRASCNTGLTFCSPRNLFSYLAFFG